MQPVPGGVTLHMACHARAQNMGQKAAEMLRLLPDADVAVVERCSGHGGSWGFKQAYFPVALKVGRPAARQMRDAGKAFVTSECPLAGAHIMQGIERLGGDGAKPQLVTHPIQIARAGLRPGVKETSMPKHELVAADILPAEEYAKHRTEHRRRVGALKRDRRVEVGPYVTFYFESYDTMWLQVQEMLLYREGRRSAVAGRTGGV